MHERVNKSKCYGFKVHGGYEDGLRLAWGHFYQFGQGSGFPMNIVSTSADEFWPSYGAKGTELGSEIGSQNDCFSSKECQYHEFKMCGVKKRLLVESVEDLSSFSTDSSGQLDVLWHNGHPLCVDGAQVGVFEKTHQVGLAGFLKSHDGRTLETQIGLEILGDFTDQALEGQLADEQLSGLLVTTDLTKGNGTGTVTMGFLDSTSSRGTLASSLGCQLFARRFATSRFTSSLLGTGHFRRMRNNVVFTGETVKYIYNGCWRGVIPCVKAVGIGGEGQTNRKRRRGTF